MFRTKIYSSIMSSFGQRFLKAALLNTMLSIDEIVLPSLPFWWRFHLKLQGKPYETPSRNAVMRFEKKLQELELLLKKSGHAANIRIIDDANTAMEAQQVSAYDYILCGAFPQLFKPVFFAAPRRGVVNFHPSYLPRCRGAHPVYWTIAKQEPFGGISSHIVTDQIDKGPLIHRHKILFDAATIDYVSLVDKIERDLPMALDACVENLNFAIRIPEKEIPEQPSYHLNDKDKDHFVDWEKESLSIISAKIRAGQAFIYLPERERIQLLPPVHLSSNDSQDVDGVAARFSTTILPHRKGSIQFKRGGEQLICQISWSYSLAERALLRLSFWAPGIQQKLKQYLCQRKFKRGLVIPFSK